MKPDRDELVAVDDAERALLGFATAYSDGTLGDMDVTDAANLVRLASGSVHVAANAFGVDAGPDDTPDTLASRMFGVYAKAAAEAGIMADVEEADRETAEVNSKYRGIMKSVLGITDADVERMDFDSANGDESPWLRAREQYVFG